VLIPRLLDGVILPDKVLHLFYFISAKKKKKKEIKKERKKDKPFTVKQQYYVCRVLLMEILWKHNSSMNPRATNPPTSMIYQLLITIYTAYSNCSYILLIQ
jgi:hypothetical protein